MHKLAALTAGQRSKWITVAVWVILAVLLTVLLPSVKKHERNNAPNLSDNEASIVAAKLIEEQFPGSAGIPALLVWHKAGGLQEQDYIVMQGLSEKIEQLQLTALTESMPLHKMPPQALEAVTTPNGELLIQPLLFEEGTQTETIKDSLTAIKEEASKLELPEAVNYVDPFVVDIAETNALKVRISGPAGILTDATDLFKNADFVLMAATVVLVLVLLLLIYRSPILAIIPLIGVGFAYLVTSPLLGWMASNDWITVDSQATAIMTVLLFGAGTDYCLFFITRFRQELIKTEDHKAAIKRTFSGAFGAIAMSGFTVVLALLALLASKYGAYQRFAIPFSLSIFIMAIASLTLVPALLAIIGRKAFIPFIPRTEKMEREYTEKTGKTHKRKDPETTFGSRVGRLVVTRPWTTAISSTLLLAVLALFTLSIPYKYDLLSSFPNNMPSKEGFELIGSASEPGELAPLTVVVLHSEDGEAKERQQQAVRETLESMPAVGKVGAAQEGQQSNLYTAFQVVLHQNPYQAEAMAAVPQIRSAAQQALISNGVAEADQRVWIGGQTAEQYDSKQVNNRDSSVVMPLVIILIAILLFVYLRSLTATIYLIATVLLSFAAALGLGWLILHYVFGVEAMQGAIPLYTFVFLIALGEDYNIFMVSSIWKKSKQMPLKQAIKEGVAQTGGVITSAGLILAATFAVLSTLPLQVLMQFGLITALGVLLDTFIVRPFLVPAITAILGEKAFWPGRREKQGESERALS